MVKIFDLQASEISLLRGGLQTLIFTLILGFQSISEKEDQEEEKKASKSLGPVLKVYGQICFYGLMVSICTFTFLAALSYMPLGDTIVISFTSPIFCVFFEWIFLNRKLTIVSVLLCLSIGKVRCSSQS